MTYWWLNPLVKISRQRKLNFDDIWQVPYADAFKANNEIFQELWAKELKIYGSKRASIGRVLVQAIKSRLLLIVFLFCFGIALSLISSVSINKY